MKKYIIIIIIIIFFLLGFFGGKYYYKSSNIILNDTVIICKYDTIIDSMPYLEKEYITRYDTLLYYINDTIIKYIPIPISSYLFTDSSYKIEAEGYNVKLKNVEIYSKTQTKYITNTVERESIKPARFGLGLQVGYGFSSHGAIPYIGIGINYNIITF